MIDHLKKKIHEGFIIYEEYKWLINSYVLDFFTENHWSKLPDSWKTMKALSINEVAELLDHNRHSKTFLFPLSILALKKIFQDLNVSRIPIGNINPSCELVQNEKLMNMFWRSVKLKKRHEILIMSELCKEMASKSDCFYIVDIGSGLGHLSRMLAYGYNFEVCSIEAQYNLTKQAEVFSANFDRVYEKIYGLQKKIRLVNMRIEPDISNEEFLNLICSSFATHSKDFKFGIVGLHPCGDLGPTLIRLYNEIPNIKYINIAGCCYMKLSTIEFPYPGFPLSQYCREKKYELCYHSKEIACHAVENYIEKLLEGEYWKLRIHAYRATIEKILSEIEPGYKHIPLANVKYAKDLDFASYCKKATSKLLGDIINSDHIETEEIQDCLQQWNSVVIFYSFRLFFAPLIESLILHDRLLYMQEKGTNVDLIPAFDNRISPRMHVLQGFKD
ncbi:methyltransferase-like protein 25B [Harmonia axyridis]|uniref:methyltransferase-like protein 25B n=1 Tax=Harmonia axyridis TaxID=115357 RepID=UPI001E276426|nr:methyltransferase-like protein 25B [Harmonia axyridis]